MGSHTPQYKRFLNGYPLFIRGSINLDVNGRGVFQPATHPPMRGYRRLATRNANHEFRLNG